MAMVSSSMGPINSVLDKLPAGVEFRSLSYALAGMKEQMRRLSVRGEVTSTLARGWLVQLREIAYDVEEWLDKRFIRSGGRFRSEEWFSDDMAQIQYFEELIKEAQDRGRSFGAHHETGMFTMYPDNEKPLELQVKDGFSCRQTPCLVGLSGSENEIVQHLIDDKQELKVIAVLGPGGLGKTTLAREVLKKQQGKFDCTAFVCVDWNPSRDAVLADIARQVMPKTLLPHDEKNIVFRLYEFLQTKRCTLLHSLG